ncbi:MAG: hypothetical protein GHCLOJNM_02935 [bacterium]|nr:hypothetical protein [bacterium]
MDASGQCFEWSLVKDERAMSNPWVAGLRLAAIVLLSLVMLAGSAVLNLIPDGRRAHHKRARRWSKTWMRATLGILGVRIVVRGPLPPVGSFLAPNHLGYLDPLGIGAVIPCAFVVAAETARWPGIGALLRASRQVFLERFDRGKQLAHTSHDIRRRLAHGEAVCAFLEGTSTDGSCVLPFHPALLESAIRLSAPVVPIAVHWSAINRKIDIGEDVAYWKDHVFRRHAWRLLGLSGIRCEIVFGNPILSSGADRKVLAALLRARVLELLRPGSLTEVCTGHPFPSGGARGTNLAEDAISVPLADPSVQS